MALTISEPLAAHEVFKERDLDAAGEIGASVLGEHQLSPTRRGGQALARMNSARTRRARLTYLRYGIALEQKSTDLDGFASVILPLTGRMGVKSRGQTASATPKAPIVLTPGGSMHTSWSHDLSMLVLTIDAHHLRQHLSALAPGVPTRRLRFDLEVRGDAVAGVVAQIDHLRRLIERSADTGSIPALLEAAVLDAVMTTLFFAQVDDALLEALCSDTVAQPRVVRVATEFLEARLQHGVSIADAARHCGVGVRTLESAFQRHLSTTPQRFLRSSRMRIARASLTQPSENTTVAQVAFDCGFGHLGRFAAYYHQAFGELPSETLRKGRQEGLSWRH